MFDHLLRNRARHAAGRRSLCPVPLLIACALVATAFSSAVPMAHADVQAPVHVRLANAPHPAEVGVAYTDILVLTPMQPGELANLRMESDGWDVRAFEAPLNKAMTAKQELRIPFTVIPRDLQEPLVVYGELDGWHFRTHLDLSPRAYQMTQGPLPVARIPDAQVTPFPGIDQSLARPEPLPAPAQPGLTEEQQAEQAAQKGSGQPDVVDPNKARWIRVHGRFVYTRSDANLVGADGVVVRVYDEDGLSDEFVTSTITDAFGWYDVSFFWNPCAIFCDSEPDLYLTFEAANSKTEVTNTGGTRYSWGTGITNDFLGTDIDFGWLQPGSPGDMPALHVLTDLTRSWRWLQNRGYDNPWVRGVWPDGPGGAWYNGDQIHVGVDREWREDTHAHEYGHHHVQHFATAVGPDYCNGICDTSPTDCGHCIWCRETDHDAYAEGWPNWLADIVTRSFAGQYGLASMNFRSQESLNTCGGTLDDPNLTEGFLGAVVRDIEDGSQDDHPEFAQGTDALALGDDEILAVVDLDQPTTPMGFLNAFKARFPWSSEGLWQTAKNCGYEIDVANPNAPTGLFSSHALFASSPDPTADFYWTRATDDCSGTAGYSIVIAGGFVFPDAFAELGNVTSYTSGVLSPGTYYFNIRAVDAAGRWSGTYAAYGPFTIRAAEPANLTHFVPGGWTYSLTPRGAADAGAGSVPAPVTLPGNTPSTYTNLAGINNGESAASANFQAYTYVDENFAIWVEWAPLPAGWWFYGANLVPITVRGGRHTYGMRHDASDAIAETNEFDNVWAHQWVWTPLGINDGVDVVRAAPPGRWAGTSWVVDGSPLYYNCDGLTMSPQYWWTAVYGYSLDMNEDYDLSLFNPSTGAQNGFDSNVVYSGRVAGYLDAAVVNLNTTAYQNYDVGVLNWSGGVGDYRVRQVHNEYLAFGDSVTVPYGQDEMLRLWEIYIPSDKVGAVSVTVDAPPGSHWPIYANWMDQSFTRGNIYTYAYTASTDVSTGRARLDMNLPTAGYHGLVVYRDPRDGVGPVDVTIEIDTTPPDYAPYLAGGWYAPLVPRPAFDGTWFSVPMPPVLYGDAWSTYFNFGMQNASPTGHAGLYSEIHLDGVYGWWVTTGPWGPYGGFGFNWDLAWWISGGRHTLSMRHDPYNSVEEIYESNNVDGQQWVWQPATMGFNTPVARGVPPAPFGGLGDFTVAEPFWVNCDGLRTPFFGGGSGYWGAVAIMPGASSDVDLRLHQPAPDAKNGFDNVLAYSQWGTGASDYVLANFNYTSFQAFDAGFTNFNATEGFVAEAVGAPYLGSPPLYSGSFLLGASSIMHLWEVYLYPGDYTILLENASGDVDWGLTLHEAVTTYAGKGTSVVPNGMAFLNGPGSNEWTSVSITTAGYYGLAVWKSENADLAKSGSYNLRITPPAPTDVGPLPIRPTVTALSSVHPNPFNPRTTIAFDLAREGTVRLSVHDAQGRLVRTLVSEARPAGRFEVSWDGHDDSGGQVASGVYIARLEAAGAFDQRKLVLVK